MSIGSGHGGSTSSLVAVHGGTPELLVALCYQSLTGRLTVEILKASNLRMPAMQRAPGMRVSVLSIMHRRCIRWRLKWQNVFIIRRKFSLYVLSCGACAAN